MLHITGSNEELRYLLGVIDSCIILEAKHNCLKQKLLESNSDFIDINNTSYVTEPPDIAGWRRVTLQMAPFAERMQTVRGPCCEKAIIFDAMSCNMGGYAIRQLATISNT